MSTLVTNSDTSKTTSPGNRVFGDKMRVGISSFGSVMLGVGTMIGSMVWLIYQPMLARAGALPTVTAWTLGAVITLPLAFVLAELASMFPAAGGPYVYKYVALKRLFPSIGELLGFSTGWLYWVALIAGIAAMTNGFATLVTSSIWPQAGTAPPWFGMASIVSLLLFSTLLNLRNVREISRLNSFFTVLKLLLAIAFVALIIFSGQSNFQNLVSSDSTSTVSGFTDNVMKVLVLSITAFGGIELVACASSETERADKSVPRSIILTLALIAVIYIGICVAICSLVPPDHFAGATRAFDATCPSVARFIGGPVWGTIFTAGVVGSIITCTVNVLLALARISYSMAETKLFPAQFATLDNKNAIPKDALWFQFWSIGILSVLVNIVATVIPSFDPYTFLGEVFGFLYSFLAMLFGVCLVSLRYTDSERPRSFRIGRSGNALAWTVSIITITVYGFIAFGCAQTAHQIASLILMLCGLPIYWLYRRKATNRQVTPESREGAVEK